MISNEPQEVNLQSRAHFIKEVLATIKKNHSAQRESFIFGISGKWGEGKTTFLDGLERSLKELNEGFEIIRVNPWKFSSDKVSFLRAFLKQLSVKIRQPWWVSIREWFSGMILIESIDRDVSVNKIRPGALTALILWSILLLIVYENFLSSDFRSLVGDWRFLTIFILPLILAAFGKIISTQQSSKQVTTVDNFDKLLKNILRYTNAKKLVIFLDDLDRVTPQTARDVLDNLRTFFDSPKLTFIVTGDHTVLERHLGRELLPNEQAVVQSEEGRRFLKKIFNVYWRLPLPIESELKVFLDGQFTLHKVSLDKFFSVEQQDALRIHLMTYFDRNFRQIQRFLETIIFTFGVIQNKSNSILVESEKKYFDELLDHPLLVIRILMIQELCSPLFEKFLQSHEIFRSLEHALEKKQSADIENIIGLESLSPTQQGFIKKFLFQEPRFYKNASLVVSDLRPFLHLAADASFSDERGPSSDDFVQIIKSANSQAVKDTLILSGDNKLQEAAKGFRSLFSEATDSAKKKEIIDTLINGLIQIDRTYSLHGIFSQELSSIDLSFYRDIPNQERIMTWLIVWRWLDGIKSSQDTWLDKFPFLHEQDFDFIQFKEEEEKMGTFTTTVLMHWFTDYYKRNRVDALSRIEPILKHLDLRTVKGQLDVGTLSTDLIEQQDNGLRTSLLNILMYYSNKGIAILRENLFERLKTFDDQNLWSWAVAQANDQGPWTTEDLEDDLISMINSVADDINFIKILEFSKNNIKLNIKELWQVILDFELVRFINSLPQIINDMSYAGIAPDSKKAADIRAAVIDKVNQVTDDTEKIRWLDYLKKDKWLWKNIMTGVKLTKVKSAGQDESGEFQKKKDEVIQSWNSQ